MQKEFFMSALGTKVIDGKSIKGKFVVPITKYVYRKIKKGDFPRRADILIYLKKYLSKKGTKFEDFFIPNEKDVLNKQTQEIDKKPTRRKYNAKSKDYKSSGKDRCTGMDKRTQTIS